MKQDIENIIKKKSKELSILLLGNIQYNDSRDNKEWRNAIIESSTEIISKELSLIADEVLKVVVEKIKEEVEKYSKQENYWDEMPNVNDFQKGALHSRNKMKDFVLQLLSNLSPNKENKNK